MNRLELLAFSVYLFDVSVDYDNDGIEIEAIQEELVDKWVNHYLPARKQEHHGDCTNEPYTCMRCLIDDWFKIAEKLMALMEQTEGTE